uniref:Uncharacterized protein n=1 Tax=Promethearchaeum syntrophicum TaxID=2594042 RepID=A0A5B9DBM4_9ARCH|nr:hypothetical protein DSAG12_01894 [Candidatus Prometheoarchaeum syntrophicum]
MGSKNEVMGVYRVHDKSYTQKNKLNFAKKRILNTELICYYLKMKNILLLKK